MSSDLQRVLENNIKALCIVAALASFSLPTYVIEGEIYSSGWRWPVLFLFFCAHGIAGYLFLAPTRKTSVLSVVAPMTIQLCILLLAAISFPDIFLPEDSTRFASMSFIYIWASPLISMFLISPYWESMGDLFVLGCMGAATFLPAASLLVGLAIKKRIKGLGDADAYDAGVSYQFEPGSDVEVDSRKRVNFWLMAVLIALIALVLLGVIDLVLSELSQRGVMY